MLLLAYSALTVPQVALAQTIRWAGDADSDWFKAENWSGDSGIPTNIKDVFIDGPTSARQPVIGPTEVAKVRYLAIGSVDFGSLTVRDGGRLEVGLDDPSNLLVVGGVSANGPGDYHGARNARGRLTVSGLGSQVITNQLELGSGVSTYGPSFTGRASGIIVVENGGLLRVLRRLVVGYSFGSEPVDNTLIFRGAGSRLEVTGEPTVQFAGSRIEVLDGASVTAVEGGSANWRLTAANAMLIDGTNSYVDFSIGASTVSGFADFDKAALTIQNGASARGDFVGPNGSTNLGPDSGSIVVRSNGTLSANRMGFGFFQSRGAMLVDDANLNVVEDIEIGSPYGENSSFVLLRNARVKAGSIRIINSGAEIAIGGLESDVAGGAGTFDVSSLSVVSGGRVILNHTDNAFSLGASISGTGTFKQLAGTTILSGISTSFGGNTLLTGGTLTVNGSFGSGGHVLNASNGATLSGTGRISGAVTLGNAILAPGGTAARLSFGGSLALGGETQLRMDLGDPNGQAGGASDLIQVSGNLTLDGTLNVIANTGFGAGLYRLINYGGTLTDNGLDLGFVPEGVARYRLTIQTSVNKQVNLLVAGLPANFTFWDGASTTTGDGRIEGGAGTWSVNSANWTTADGLQNGKFSPNDLLIFALPSANSISQQTALFASPAVSPVIATPSSAAGIVTVDDDEGDIVLRNGVQFAVNGYLVTGSSIDLAATTPCGECTPLPGKVIFRVGDGSQAGAEFVATVQSALTGAAGLEKTDLGTLIISGANDYAGGTKITNGTLQGNTTSLQGVVDIGEEGNLVFAQIEAGTFAGALSGKGVFAKLGEGRLELTGDSSAFSGHTAVNAGELAVMGTLGSGHSLTLDNGATLSGTGRIGGTVAIVDGTVSAGGAKAAAGATPSAQAVSTCCVGNLTIDGDLSLSSRANLAFDLGAPTGEAGVASDLITVSANLVLDGLLNVNDAGGFGAGIYRLINYGGSLTDNGLDIGTLPEGFLAANFTIQTSVANSVNLVVGGQPSRFSFWEGGNTSGDGMVNGGAGTWRADTTNWT